LLDSLLQEMFLFLMISLITILPISGEEQEGNSGINSKPAANESDVAIDLVSKMLENVVFLNSSDYLPENYVYTEKVIDDVQDKEDTSNESDEESIKSSENISTFDAEKIQQLKKSSTVDNLEERKPIRRFTSRPFVPTQSIKVVAGLPQATISHPHTKGNSSVAVKPARRRLKSRVITSKPLRSRPLTSAPRTTPYKAITTTPATPSTTPGVCKAFCSLSGEIVIKSGLQWKEELLHSFTKYYKKITGEIVVGISEVFRDTYGSSFEFASVEEYTAVGENIRVNFFVQFDGYTISNVTTTILKDALKENLRKVGTDEFKLGKFIIDMSATDFRVVDTSQPLELFTPGDDSLPSWAWLALLGGTVSTIIIAIIGTVACVQMYRRDAVVKKRVNQRLVETLQGEKHFGRGGVGMNKDKRDMWAVQRELQAVIGMRTGGGGGHDDSSAGLMGGLDNTWLHNTSRLEAENGPEEEVIVDRSVFSRNNKLRMTGGDIL